MADISKEQQDAILFIEFLEAAYKLGRNAGLEEAQKKVSAMPWIDGNSIPSNHEMARAIESLKDNTP